MTTTTTVGDLPVGQRRIIRAWCMYDWANSAFATSGVAAIIPIYFVFLFKDALGENASFLGLTFTGSSVWSLGVATSTAIVALSSPLLGIIADRAALKKTLLGIYAAAGSLFTALAFFSAYTSHPWAWIGVTFILANVGFAGSLVFYNSLLPHIAPRGLLDDVSSRGFSYGYIGGGLLLLVHLALNLLVRDTDAADLVTRLSIASVGVWWFGWAVWTLKVVPEPPVREAADRLTPWRALTMAVGQLGRTFRQVSRFRVVLAYLGAYLLFNDGVQTIISIAGAFAADTLGIPLAFNMATILIIQFVAAGGAMAFAWLARRTATKTALTVALAGWVLIVLGGVAVVPLEPARHGEFDYQLSIQSGLGSLHCRRRARRGRLALGVDVEAGRPRYRGGRDALARTGQEATGGRPPVRVLHVRRLHRGRQPGRRDGGRARGTRPLWETAGWTGGRAQSEKCCGSRLA